MLTLFFSALWCRQHVRYRSKTDHVGTAAPRLWNGKWKKMTRASNRLSVYRCEWHGSAVSVRPRGQEERTVELSRLVPTVELRTTLSPAHQQTTGLRCWAEKAGNWTLYPTCVLRLTHEWIKEGFSRGEKCTARGLYTGTKLLFMPSYTPSTGIFASLDETAILPANE
ncbi:hypothetical protein BaRGS_00027427, partial [Batillaria attramentaria]